MEPTSGRTNLTSMEISDPKASLTGIDRTEKTRQGSKVERRTTIPEEERSGEEENVNKQRARLLRHH